MYHVSCCPVYKIYSMLDMREEKEETTKKGVKRLTKKSKFLEITFTGVGEGDHVYFTLVVKGVIEKTHEVDAYDLLLDEALLGKAHPPSQREVVFNSQFYSSELMARLPEDLFRILGRLAKHEIPFSDCRDILFRVTKILFANFSDKKVLNFFPALKDHFENWRHLERVKPGRIYLAQYQIEKSKGKVSGPVLVVEEEIVLPLRCFALKHETFVEINDGRNFLMEGKEPIEIFDVTTPTILCDWLTSSDEQKREDAKWIAELLKKVEFRKLEKLVKARNHLKKVEARIARKAEG
jgi:hypothetical protein